MTIEQTIEIPADRRVKIPETVPLGYAKMILVFPDAHTDATIFSESSQHYCASLEEVEAALSRQHGAKGQDEIKTILRRAHGAWKENPWQESLAAIREMRDGWVNPWKQSNE
jgi:hypothetical protein